MLQAVSRLALISGLIVIGAVTVPAARIASAAGLNIAVSSPSESFVTRSLRRYAVAVTQAGAGRLKVGIEAREQGRPAPELLDGLMRNTSPVIAIPLPALRLDDPLPGLDSVAFLTLNYPRAQKLWQVVRPRLVAALKAKGLRLLYTLPASPAGLISRRPLMRASDFQGRLILDSGGPLARLIPASGAQGLRIKAAAVAGAFKKQGLDFIFISAEQAVQDQAWGYARYFNRISAWFPKHLVLINEGYFQGLDQPSQSVLLETAAAAEQAAWAESERRNDRRIQMLRDYGMKIIKPTVALQLDLQALGRKLLFSWSQDAGEAGTRLVEDYYAIR